MEAVPIRVKGVFCSRDVSKRRHFWSRVESFVWRSFLADCFFGVLCVVFPTYTINDSATGNRCHLLRNKTLFIITFLLFFQFFSQVTVCITLSSFFWKGKEECVTWDTATGKVDLHCTAVVCSQCSNILKCSSLFRLYNGDSGSSSTSQPLLLCCKKKLLLY